MHQPVMTLSDKGVLVALASFSLFVTSCRPESASSQGAASMDKNRAVTVFAAASMKDAIEDLTMRFREKSPGPIDISLGASNQLAMQIMQGAPADIFISASVEWADKLCDSGLIDADRRFVGNRLAIVALKDGIAAKIFADATRGSSRLQQLLHPSIKLVALAEENVPAGKYAAEALTKAGVFAELQSTGRIVRGGDVRIVLSYVESGNVDAGVVYVSDAKASRKVDLLCIVDENLHTPIRYPIMFLKCGRLNERARRLSEFLDSEQARTVFKARGFAILDESQK